MPQPFTKPFDILAGEYRPMVLAYLRSLGIDPHQVEDLAQETFLAAWQAIGKFEKGRSFGGWLRGIARNKALMHWRAASVRPPLGSDPRSVEGIEEVFSSVGRRDEEGDWWDERREALRACVGKLSSSLRDAVKRVYTHGDSLGEAAAALGVSRDAVAQRLSRARGLIRRCVALHFNHLRSHE